MEKEKIRKLSMEFSGVCPNGGALSPSNNFSSSKQELDREWNSAQGLFWKISQLSNIHFMKFLANSRTKDLVVTHLCFKQWSHYIWIMYGGWTNTRKYFSLERKANIYVCRRKKAKNGKFFSGKDEETNNIESW
jgi:hypothetical protein